MGTEGGQVMEGEEKEEMKRLKEEREREFECDGRREMRERVKVDAIVMEERETTMRREQMKRGF